MTTMASFEVRSAKGVSIKVLTEATCLKSHQVRYRRENRSIRARVEGAQTNHKAPPRREPMVTISRTRQTRTPGHPYLLRHSYSQAKAWSWLRPIRAYLASQHVPRDWTISWFQTQVHGPKGTGLDPLPPFILSLWLGG